jgi:ribonuclease R
MEQHIGEVYEGVVSGVTAWGMFVELDNTCEGMIRLAELTDDYYVFDEQNFTLTGTDFGKEYRLGQKVKIKVVGADRLEKTVDFRIVDEDTDPDDIELKPAKKHYVLKLMEEEAARKSEQDALKDKEHSKAEASKDGANIKSTRKKKKRNLEEISDEFEEIEDHYRSRKHTDLDDIDLEDGEDDNLMTALELREHLRKKRMIEGLEPDGRTGSPREKKRKGVKNKENGPKEKGHKKYKVHKYKKSATSKAARSNQKKKR